MQTFVPTTDFAECAHVLTDRHLHGQRTDCHRVLSVLRAGGPEVIALHPATLMWHGYESALGVFTTFVEAEWRRRFSSDSSVTPYSRETFLLNSGWYGDLAPDGRDAELPPWWGDDRVHKSHRNALLYKDQSHYRQFQWGGMPILDYFWPVTGAAEYTPGPVHPGHQYASVFDRSRKSAQVRET